MAVLVAFLFLVPLLVVTREQQLVRSCVPPAGQPPCVCQTDRGVISLKQISRSNGVSILSTTANDTFNYTFNPCYGFSDGPNCQNISGCQSSSSVGSFSLGVPSTERMYIVDDSAVLYYTGGANRRSMYVRLHCNTNLETPVLTTEGDTGHPLFYVFDLYSRCACPGECGDQALSMGALAGIIISSLVLLALIGIVAIISVVILHRYYHRHKRVLDGTIYRPFNSIAT